MKIEVQKISFVQDGSPVEMYANNVAEATSHGEIANLSISTSKKEVQVQFVGINPDLKNSEKIRTNCGLTGYSFKNKSIFHLYED